MRIVTTKEEILARLDLSNNYKSEKQKSTDFKKEKAIPIHLQNTGVKGFLDLVTSGIYFLWDKGNMVYVGESYCIMSRVVTHQKEKKKIFNEFTWLEFEGSPMERKDLEREYIKAYSPYYNKKHKFKKKKKDVHLILGHKRLQ